MAPYGVLISKGPKDWQILQQNGRKADIPLEGTWDVENGMPGSVHVRAVREDNGESAVPWQKAETCGERKWRTALRDVPAGGLYRIETGFLPDGFTWLEWMLRGDMIHHLAVGDLYVIAGQSNAAGYGKDPACDPPELGVHLLRNTGRWDLATHPLNDTTASAHLANCEAANPGHSPWLHFAKIIRRETGMPVGLVQTSLGGSALDTWLPGGPLYENMMEIISSAGGRIRGVLWYQGCADTAFPLCETYLDRFSGFVGAVRSALGEPGLPFITMQINRHVTASSPDYDRGWSIVREAQRQAARTIPGVYVAATVDSKVCDGIHISASSNLMLGERAARIALGAVYGKKIPWESPDAESAEITENGVLLRFKHVSERIYLACAADRLPFRLEDEAGLLQIAEFEQPSFDAILLKTSRKITGCCSISSHYGNDPQGVSAVDTGSWLPAPAFYNIKLSCNN